MTDVGEVAQALGYLLIAGIIFVIFGSALADTALQSSFLLNFQFWGYLYITAAVVLGIMFVIAILASFFNGL